MDPNATFRLWIDADADRHEIASTYNAWLARGGFPATYRGHDVVELTGYSAGLSYRQPDGSEVRTTLRPCILDTVEPVGKAVRS